MTLASYTPASYTEFLHRNIPLVAAMQARVVACGDGGIELRAPLAPNRNHRGTAFGGSLAVLGIAAGWALVEQGLREAGIKARVVIQKSECEYFEPVAEEFSAAGTLPAGEWPQFLDTLRKRGKARIAVESELRSAGRRPAVRHRGTFVAIESQPEKHL